MITFHTMEQGSQEWLDIRTENPFTASEAQAIATGGAGLETLIVKKLSEKYSKQKESFSNVHTERGKELEPVARTLYSLITGNDVQEVGFITNKKYEKAGCSPDGLVGYDGMVEIKCFEDKKHFLNIIKLKIESQYQWQMQFQMLIAERNWNDFVVYNPNFEKEILIQRVEKDEVAHQKLITGLAIGIKKYKEMEADYLKAIS